MKKTIKMLLLLLCIGNAKAEITYTDILPHCNGVQQSGAQIMPYLFLASVGIMSNYFTNFRIKGNIDPKIANDGRRRYDRDSGLDGIAQLCVELFPSHAGNLAIHSKIKESRADVIKDIVDRLVRTEFYRYVLERKAQDEPRKAQGKSRKAQDELNFLSSVFPELPEKDVAGGGEENIQTQTQDTCLSSEKIKYINASTKSADSLKVIRNATLVSGKRLEAFLKIRTSDNQESKEELSVLSANKMLWRAVNAERDFGYPTYTAEALFFAFLCKFMNADEITTFIDIYAKGREEFFNKEYLENSVFLRMNNVDSLIDTLKGRFSTASPNMYNNPVENGRSYKVEKNASSGKLEEKSDIFPDCQETAIRHIILSLLLTQKIEDFKKTNGFDAITSRIGSDNIAAQNRFAQLADVCAVDDYNCDSIEHRTMVNKVFADLNTPSDTDETKVRYQKTNNELSVGFINIVRVLEKVFGVKSILSDFKHDKTALVNRLEYLFNIINPYYKYTSKESMSFSEDKKDYYGTLCVTMTSPSPDAVTHRFTVHQEMGHGRTTFGLGPLSIEDFEPSVRSWIGYLCSPYDGRNPFHAIFSSKCNRDPHYSYRQVLKLLKESYSSEKDTSMLDHILGNVVRNISFNDLGAAEMLFDTVLQWDFNETEYSRLRTIITDSNPSAPLPDALMYMKRHLTISSPKVVDLDLSTCKRLHELEIDGGDISGCVILKNPLKRLIISDTKIGGKLDLSKCNSIEELEIENAQIGEMSDLSASSELKRLNIINSVVGGGGVIPPSCVETLTISSSQIRGNLDLSSCSSIEKLYILEDLNVSLSDLSKDVTITGNVILPSSLNDLFIYEGAKIGGLDLSRCSSMDTLSIRCTVSGDVIPPSCIKTLDIENGAEIGGKIDLSGCSSIETLCIGEKAKITGDLVQPSSLNYLFIYEDAKIDGKLDLSGCDRLNELSIYENVAIAGDLTLPQSLGELSIRNGATIDGKLDFSRCTLLDRLSLAGNVTIAGGVVVSLCSLRTLYIGGAKAGRKLDLSEYKHVETLVIDRVETEGDVILPSSIKALDIRGAKAGGKLDLSDKQLETLYINKLEIAGDVILPSSIKALPIDNGTKIGGKLDLSKCDRMNGFGIDSEVTGGVILPSSIETLDIGKNAKIGGLDLSRCSLLKTRYFVVDGEITGDVILPSSIKALPPGTQIGGQQVRSSGKQSA
jgi:hypothetical protein